MASRGGAIIMGFWMTSVGESSGEVQDLWIRVVLVAERDGLLQSG
jgi:hypothetical protein